MVVLKVKRIMKNSYSELAYESFKNSVMFAKLSHLTLSTLLWECTEISSSFLNFLVSIWYIAYIHRHIPILSLCVNFSHVFHGLRRVYLVNLLLKNRILFLIWHCIEVVILKRDSSKKFWFLFTLPFFNQNTT